MNTLKVSDSVIVKNDLQEEEKYSDIMFHYGMGKFRGKKVTIGNIPYSDKPGVFNILEDDESYLWTESMFLKETCQFCEGYQQEELGAGLREGCVTDELYEDEDCQIIKDNVNDTVTAFMHGKIEKCPYFNYYRR